jgi:adenosylhomocysteinase
MTIQTAVLIQTLTHLGATVRWSSCNIFSTQDQAAAAIADSGIPVFAWKGETEEEYEWCIEQTIQGPDGWTPNMILDDGGDLTLVMHEKYPELMKEVRASPRRPRPACTGSTRWRRRARSVPGHQRQRQRHQVEVRQQVRLPREPGRRHPPRHRRDDGRQGRGRRGFGDVGKGSAESLRHAGCRVMVTEIDPICALQAAMEGYEVVTMEDAAPRGDIFVTATGNIDVITLDHMRAMKDGRSSAISATSTTRSSVAALKNFKWTEVKPQVDEIEFPDGKQIILLAKGRLVNLGCGTGHPSFVMSASFTNQVLAQIELWNNPEVREQGLRAAQASRREGGRPASRQAGRQADPAERRPGRLYRRRAAGPVQVRAVPLLSVVELGLDEAGDLGILLVEWPLRAGEGRFPPSALLITIEDEGGERATLHLTSPDEGWRHRLAKLINPE